MNTILQTPVVMLLIKATAMLAVAAAAAGRPAAPRVGGHTPRRLDAGHCALLALPVLSVSLPEWPVAIPAWSTEAAPVCPVRLHGADGGESARGHRGCATRCR